LYVCKKFKIVIEVEIGYPVWQRCTVDFPRRLLFLSFQADVGDVEVSLKMKLSIRKDIPVA